VTITRRLVTTRPASVTTSRQKALAAVGSAVALGGLAGCSGPSPTTPATPLPTTPISLHDGTFTGAVATTPRGDVQVVIDVANGRITDIRVPVAPGDLPMSQQLTTRAVPILVQEGLSAQSAHVDTVSGATYTSDGYRRSLQSAIDQAAA